MATMENGRGVSVYTLGIKHGFLYINICQVPREVLNMEVENRGF